MRRDIKFGITLNISDSIRKSQSVKRLWCRATTRISHLRIGTNAEFRLKKVSVTDSERFVVDWRILFRLYEKR